MTKTVKFGLTSVEFPTVSYSDLKDPYSPDGKLKLEWVDVAD